MPEIFVGQASDNSKKRRLGCYQRPLYIYAKGTRKLVFSMIRFYFSRRESTDH